MAKAKKKTQKIMNIDCGCVWLEVILEVIGETHKLVIYKKYFIIHTEAPDQMEAYSYRTVSRRKIHECSCLVNALDWISTQIKTGEYINL